MSIYLGGNNITGGFTTEEKKQFNNSINLINEQLDDKVNKTDITTTINSTSSDTQIPTAKSVNVAIKGKLVTQDDINTYGKEIIKFPVGKWTIGSVAINNLTDLPNSYVRYVEIMGISEVTNPWTNDNTLRSYKATSYKGDTFLRSLNSGSEAGVIAFDTGWQRVLLNGDIIDNLTSTDTNKLLSANQGKILNDTKLNKTDANKLNCVTIDNVSLKEYILTNFTGTEKTYYLIAKTTCTDLPKASNFYITVETPGLYTYKVTAKELNDSNGIYVCTYRTLSSSWTEWEKVLNTGDITTTISDSSTDTQVSSAKAVYTNIQAVNKTIGTESLTTTATTLKGAINEVKNTVVDVSAGYAIKLTGNEDYVKDKWFMIPPGTYGNPSYILNSSYANCPNNNYVMLRVEAYKYTTTTMYKIFTVFLNNGGIVNGYFYINPSNNTLGKDIIWKEFNCFTPIKLTTTNVQNGWAGAAAGFNNIENGYIEYSIPNYTAYWTYNNVMSPNTSVHVATVTPAPKEKITFDIYAYSSETNRTNDTSRRTWEGSIDTDGKLYFTTKGTTMTPVYYLYTPNPVSYCYL